MKTCTQCNVFKPAESFSRSKIAVDGRQSWCKQCKANDLYLQRTDPAEHNKKKLERKQERKRRQRKPYSPRKCRITKHETHSLREYINDYKKSHGCSHCQNEYDPIALDFHHLRDKLFTISAGVVRDKQRDEVIAEMKKCILLCANCHRKLHAGRFIIANNHLNRLYGL